MQTDGSSYFLEAREESASGGGLLSGELPAHTLFVSPSKGIVTEPSVELLRAFTEASIRSGVTIEWSASADALSLLKSSEAAEGYGSSCPVDAEAFLLKAHMDGLEGMDGLLLGKYRVEGTARRRRGGQGMIAFASEEQGGPGDVVIKAYFCSRTFERERRLLENPQLKHAAAACIEVVDRRDACAAEESEDDSDEDRTLPMVTNTVVPMLVVSERGECLREYMQKKVPAAWGSRLQVIYEVAKLLRTMHVAGYAHRDIKPGNVVWLPSRSAWSLIDFGCAAQIGWQMPLSFTLWYAAPETIVDFKNRQQMCTASTATDIFAFGIVCYEVLTGTTYYPLGVTTSGAGEMLTGQAPLAHETMSEEDGKQKLGILHGAVLRMLDRDPQERGTIHDVLEVLAPLFESE